MKGALPRFAAATVGIALAILLAVPITARQGNRTSGTLTSATCSSGGCVNLGVAGLGSVGIQITGTWSGTVTFEGSVDGQTYTTLNVAPINDPTTPVTTTTSNGIWSSGAGGLQIVRARMSAYTSGTARVTIQGAEPTLVAGSPGGGGGGNPFDQDLNTTDSPSFVALALSGADPTTLTGVPTKNYVDTAIAAVNTGGGAAQNSFLVNGGQVIWTSDYNFIVSAGSAYLEGVLFTWAQQTVTLDAADPTNPRIDAIVVSSAGTVSDVTGDAAAQPSAPVLDPGTQLFLTNVTVAAGSTEPAEVVSTLLYCDNVGDPTEWDFTTSGSGFNTNSSNNPIAGCTRSIEGTTVAANAYAQGQIGSGTFDPNDANFLIFHIRSKATWANNRGLTITLRNAGVQVGSPITFNRTAFGFNSAQTSTYQQIAIPILQFGIPNGSVITQVRFQDFGGSIGFYIGNVGFQGGVTIPANPGITQDQADARYAFRGLTTASGLTMATDRLLGRDTASTGAIEELTLGAGLAISGGALTLTGGGAALSALTAATGANTIANGTNAQVWNWALTGTGFGFTFGETTAATGGNSTGNQAILKIATLSAGGGTQSTAVPLLIVNEGNGYGFRVDDVADDTAPFAIDNDGRVGINSAPSAALFLTIGSNGQNNNISFSNAGATIGDFANGWGTLTASDFYLITNGSNQPCRVSVSLGSFICEGDASTTFGASTPIVQLGDRDNALDGLFVLGFGFTNDRNNGNVGIAPAFIGMQQTDTATQTKGKLVFATRDVVSNTAPTIRLTINTDGTAVFTHNVDAPTFSAGGDSGHTGTACTAFTGGLCTTGTAPGELTPVQKKIAALEAEVAELRAAFLSYTRSGSFLLVERPGVR